MGSAWLKGGAGSGLPNQEQCLAAPLLCLGMGMKTRTSSSEPACLWVMDGFTGWQGFLGDLEHSLHSLIQELLWGTCQVPNAGATGVNRMDTGSAPVHFPAGGSFCGTGSK